MKTLFYSTCDEIVNSKKDKSLFDRLGGAATINQVVEKFYEFQLNDQLTGRFFENVDMKKIK